MKWEDMAGGSSGSLNGDSLGSWDRLASRSMESRERYAKGGSVGGGKSAFDRMRDQADRDSGSCDREFCYADGGAVMSHLQGDFQKRQAAMQPEPPVQAGRGQPVGGSAPQQMQLQPAGSQVGVRQPVTPAPAVTPVSPVTPAPGGPQLFNSGQIQPDEPVQPGQSTVGMQTGAPQQGLAGGGSVRNRRDAQRLAGRKTTK